MAETTQSIEAKEYIDELLFVMKLHIDMDGHYGGWRKELLVEKITSSVEEKLLLCTLCKGMLRDACVFNFKFLKREARCDLCIPRGYQAEFKKKAELVRSVIDEKLIHCPVCEWIGPTIDVQSHLKHCQYLPVPCPLGCLQYSETLDPFVLFAGIQKIPKLLLETHLTHSCPMRMIPCDYCLTEIRVSCVNSHLQNCEEYPIQCPNKCTFQSQSKIAEVFAASRRAMNDHLNTDCPLQPVKCPYSEYGCEDQLLRKDLQLFPVRHSLKHLNLVESCLKSTRVELRSKVDENQLLLNTMSSQLLSGGIEWRVMGFERRKNSGNVFNSPPFYCCGYKLRFAIEFNNYEHIGVYAHLFKGENDDILTWPFKGQVSFILVHENKTSSQYNCEETIEITGSNSLKKPSSGMIGIAHFISHYDIYSKGFCTDNSILLRVLVSGNY